MKGSQNVMFVLTGLDRGGLENYLLRFIKFKGEGFNNIFVLCKGGKAGDLYANFSGVSNVTVIVKKIGYINSLDYIWLYRFLKANKINAICDFTGNFACLPLLIAKTANVEKRIVFYRKDSNIFKESKLNLIFNDLLNLLLPSVSTDILSNSISAFNFFFGSKWKDDPKFEVIYNGIDATTFRSGNGNIRGELEISKSAFVVGHVGRYNSAKNHKTIIEVAIRLCSQHADMAFVICGQGTKDNLQDTVRRHGLERQIHLLGLRTDVVNVLNTLDCFYFPSYSEGQPNALIEALIVGLPFVASNIEPNKETIPTAFHDQLIDPDDADSAIAKIMQIKNDKNRLVNLNISDWAIKQFDPDLLFNKFYNKF